MGIEVSARGLENKISRGGFSAAFLLQCSEALKVNRLDLWADQIRRAGA
ncbi:MAG: DUF6471 domain-containing protein [Hyphomonas sp.]